MAPINDQALDEALQELNQQVHTRTAAALARTAANSFGKTVAEVEYLLKQELQREGIKAGPDITAIARTIAGR